MDAKQVDGRIKRMLGGIRQAFRGKIARTDAGGGVQRTQIEGLDGETVQALEHAEQFGFTGHPPAGSDCIVLPLGGQTSHGIVVNTCNGAYRNCISEICAYSYLLRTIKCIRLTISDKF